MNGHLSGGFLGDDPTGGSDDPNTPVINLTTDSSALPTNPPVPLATDDSTDVPTTPSDPMQTSPPVPLAVVDPNTLLAPAPAPVVTVAPTPKSGFNQKALLIGAGVLGLYLLTRTHLHSAPAKRSYSKSRRRSHRRRY